jgi:hypothetical protein
MPPLAAGPHEVEQPVQQAPHVGHPRMASWFGGQDERFEKAILLVAQGLTGPVVPNQRAGLERPHGGSLWESRPERFSYAAISAPAVPFKTAFQCNVVSG